MQQLSPNIFMTVHERLKAERERLNLTQPELAASVGVGKTTVINWEKGASSPTAAQLAGLHGLGIDPLFVITGERSQPISAPAVLPPRQRALLDNYEAADDAGKRVIEGAADLAAQSSEKVSRKSARASADVIKRRKRAA